MLQRIRSVFGGAGMKVLGSYDFGLLGLWFRRISVFTGSQLHTCSVLPSFAVLACGLVLGQQRVFKKSGVEQGSNSGLSHTQPTILPIGLVCNMFNLFLV